MTRSTTAKALLRLTAALLPLALAACVSAPKKSASESMPVPDNGGVHGAPLPHGKKKSPYAAAKEDPSKRGDYVAGGLFRPGEKDTTPDHVPDVDEIPEPEVTSEPRSKVGNRPVYAVLGKKYKVLDNPKGYVEKGTASYYGQKFHGRKTSNLEVYDMYAFTAAHKTLPLPSFARVTNLDNGKSVVVRVNDRGPFHEGRVIDLSYAAAVKLGITQRGTGRVEVRALTADDDGRSTAAAEPAPKPAKPSAIDTLVAAMPIASANAGELPQGARVTEKRFDMGQDGQPMTAAEFDAWMKARRITVATGKPAPVQAQQTAPATTTANNEGVTLQIASFATRDNADRALSILRGAGIGEAMLLDGSANGQKVWRLRVGPLQAEAAPALAERIAGLGFGQPQRVRD
ncbi:septal ring lytic transglycosylase RlpA family protein [Lysobacter niastensis]|uniref:Endolytic peptidoglycan transglycosylase RlpA n=1 Tax=Lysobacter niastensis TaxID=380629 RepID=A0ABS0B8B0_9GAMM|nr:septal ring lytic transglycosylase RlpA family protein [Lysobacter niastensis]MBF6025148.1 septal ring lytic transglycosylase RlpA family protein [Lysobacter niastensis]